MSSGREVGRGKAGHGGGGGGRQSGWRWWRRRRETVGVALVVTAEVRRWRLALEVDMARCQAHGTEVGKRGGAMGRVATGGESDGTACPKLIVDNLGRRR